MVNEGDSVGQAVIDELLSGRFSLMGFSTNRAKARIGAIGGDVDSDDGRGASRILKAYEELLIPERVREIEENRNRVTVHGGVVSLSSKFQVSSGVRKDRRKQNPISFAVLIKLLGSEIFDGIFGSVLDRVVKRVIVRGDKPASGERGGSNRS